MLESARRSARRPHVLCVDDDAVLTLMMRHLLARDGYEVDSAGTVAEVRDRLPHQPPDLVVLDARLPDGSGFDLCRELKAAPGWEDVPVLVVTGLNDEASVTAAYDAGAIDYVTKPIAWEVFRQRVKRLIHAGQVRTRLEGYEARVAGLMALIEEAILTYDAERKIESFAPSAVRMFGLPAAEAVGSSLATLFPDPLPEATDEMAYATVRARRADGAPFLADVSIHRVRDRGVPLTLLVARDVTERARVEHERRALEDRLRQARQQEALAALSGGVAHDLNSALTAVLGFAESARAVVTDPKAAEHLQQAEAAVHRARRLVNQLLAYAGRSRPDLRPTDLAALLADLPGTVERPRPSIRLEPGGPVQAMADPDQLRYALSQLVTNALEAATEYGKVIVRTGRGRVEPGALADAAVNPDLPAGEYAFVEVADTGPGMPAEVLGRVFEPFFTTKPLGRGLGLSVVAGVVKAHGGALTLRSAPGEGTTVRVWLPLAEVPTSVEPSEPPARFRPGTRVLVVDDEDLVRAVLKAMLERKGCEVLTAANGREGVDLFRQEGGRVDAVLLDLNMPVLDGEAALEELAATGADVPVWLMTGYDPGDRDVHLAERRVRGVLRKPLSSEALFRTLSSALGT